VAQSTGLDSLDAVRRGHPEFESTVETLSTQLPPSAVIAAIQCSDLKEGTS
jgi:hypothetical protein